MKRFVITGLALLTLVGAGCGTAAPAPRVQGPPPTPPEHIPTPTSVKPLGRLPTEASLAVLSDDARANLLNAYMKTNEGSETVAASMNAPAGKTSASGSFHDVRHKVSGSAKVVVEDGKAKLVLSDDFKTEWGPDLRVVVSTNADPKTSEDLHSGTYAELGRLRGTKGMQVYDLGAVKPEDIKSVTIYCKPFKVVFGTAEMK